MTSKLLQDPDALEAFEVLAATEAGELVRWEILGVLADRADSVSVRELCAWAIPIQQRHVEDVRRGALQLAR